MLEIYKAILN